MKQNLWTHTVHSPEGYWEGPRWDGEPGIFTVKYVKRLHTESGTFQFEVS